MKDKRHSRMRRRLEAIQALEAYSGIVMNLLAEVIHDLMKETQGMKVQEQDQAYTVELCFRLTNGILYGDEDLEPLDGVVPHMLACYAVNVWRTVCRKQRLRHAPADRIQVALRDGVAKSIQGMRVRVERQTRKMGMLIKPMRLIVGD